MTKRFQLLGGAAIVAVVCNHAVGHGYTAMFWWAHKYRDVISPSFDQLGSPTYYWMVTLEQLTFFAVPAFLVISGYFVAYASLGPQSSLTGKFLKTRILNLLWPYLIWSFVMFTVNALEGNIYPLSQYLIYLVLGQAVGAYFFIPLLIQFYLLSPVLVPLAKRWPRLLLLSAALLQFAVIGLDYKHQLGGQLYSILSEWPWVPFGWMLYFPLGIVLGVHRTYVMEMLKKLKWILIPVTPILVILSVFEVQWLYAATGDFTWSHTAFRLSTSLYALTFILSFLTLPIEQLPIAQGMRKLGSMSYGIYLIHPKTMNIASRVIYHIVPWMLAYQAVLIPVLFLVSLGIPILLMNWVARSRFKSAYRLLFG